MNSSIASYSKYFRLLGDRLMHKNLWSADKASMAKGAAVGMFLCWLPIPFQMVLGILAAALLRVNLPLVMLGVWISNPLTWVPMYAMAYYVGYLILRPEDNPLMAVAEAEDFSSILGLVPDTLGPALVGGLALQLVSAAAAYSLVLALHTWVVRLLRTMQDRGWLPSG